MLITTPPISRSDAVEMPEAAPSIETLLCRHATQCVDLGGRLVDARAMLPTWRHLWNEFAAYIEIRRLIMRSGSRGRFCRSELSRVALADHLVEAKLLEFREQHYQIAGPRSAQRLRGGWLEELGAAIASEAGCEEVRFSQRLIWQSQYSEETYHNEVDVLARFGSDLIFVSCKALAPLSCESANGTDSIFDALKEVAYWRQHFNGGQGRAILLTTADLINEQQKRFRNASLMDHADVLNVGMVSADAGDFSGLTIAFRRAIFGKNQLESRHRQAQI